MKGDDCHTARKSAIEDQMIERAEARADVRFTCFRCRDGNTPLYCLNCAEHLLSNQPKPNELLGGLRALTNPDYHKLNVHAGRNDRLLHAVLCAYAKHVLSTDEIGWEELGDILHSAICNEIGDMNFTAWAESINPD